MANQGGETRRVLKSAWFSRAARKARIPDEELCSAVFEAMRGQADDLGGGVFQEAVGQESIPWHHPGQRRNLWVFEYLFAKKDRANIDRDELIQFRRLARAYEGLAERQIEELVRDGGFVEICGDGKA
jgi:hypothetical protein